MSTLGSVQKVSVVVVSIIATLLITPNSTITPTTKTTKNEQKGLSNQKQKISTPDGTIQSTLFNGVVIVVSGIGIGLAYAIYKYCRKVKRTTVRDTHEKEYKKALSDTPSVTQNGSPNDKLINSIVPSTHYWKGFPKIGTLHFPLKV